jgi:hypothetical protein
LLKTNMLEDIHPKYGELSTLTQWEPKLLERRVK